MSNFEVKELVLENINGGRQYTDSDGVSASAINAVVEASAWAQKTANDAKLLAETASGTNVDAFFTRLLDAIAPLHKIQIFTDSTDPASVYGGYWLKVKDAFLWCSGDTTYITYTKNGASVTEYLSVGSKGGEMKHKLTVGEMPSHDHEVRADFGTGRLVDLVSDASGGASTQGAYFNSSSAASLSHSSRRVTTHLKGSGTAHNNMPPYFAVNAWYRVTEVEFNAGI